MSGPIHRDISSLIFNAIENFKIEVIHKYSFIAITKEKLVIIFIDDTDFVHK